MPAQSHTACREALVAEIRQRLLGKAGKTFPIETLRRIIQNHGRFPPSESDLVRPKNFELMQERLERLSALLLTGPPGTGKTMVSLELARLLQQGEDAYEIIDVLHGPAQIRQQWKTEGRQLFMVEDPWGGYKTGDEAASWKKDLPSLFAELRQRPGKRIIVTTRAGVLAGVGGGELAHELRQAEVSLLPDDYSKVQRREILHRALTGSHAWQREWLSQHEERILEALPEPMALDRLGKRVVDAKKRGDLDAEKLILKCAQDVLGSQFAEEVSARGGDSFQAAIALWAWHGLHGGIREETIPDLSNSLRQGGLDPRPDVQKLLHWTEASGWWPRQENGWRVHPTLLEGLDKLAGSEPEATNRLLGALVGGLLKAGRTAESLRLRLQVRARLTDLEDQIEGALADYAFGRFTGGPEAEAARAYYDVLPFLHVAHPVAKLLKLIKPQKQSMMGLKWALPSLDPSVITELSTSTEARAGALRFIRFVVATDHDQPYDGAELFAFFRRFGWDFSQDCLEIALEELSGYPGYSCATLVSAALSGDNPAYERTFDAALNAVAEMKREEATHDESERAARQWEVSPGNLQHWYDSRADDWFRLASAVEAAVKVCRQRAGWLRLAAYPRVDELVPFWVEALKAGAEVSEVEEIASVCGAKQRDIFWKAAAESGQAEFVSTLLKDIASADDEKLQDCLNALVRLVVPSDYPAVILPFLKALPWPRRATLELHSTHRLLHGRERAWWDDCFSPDEEIALRCCEASRRDANWPADVPPAAIASLESLAVSAKGEQAAQALAALTKVRHPAPFAILRLWQSEKGEDRRQALLAAVSASLPELGDWLRVGTTDPEARVRETALRQRASAAGATLRGELLALRDDPSALVRKALAEIIGEHGWKDGVPVLLHLIRDKVDFADYDDPSEGYRLEVARAAARSLDKVRPLNTSVIDEILEFLGERPTRDSPKHDYKVHRLLLDSLAGESDARILPLLLNKLSDSWNVAAWRNHYYPLRSKAAWALWAHLEKRPEEIRQVPPPTIAAAAESFNSDIAGPALVVLGILGKNATAELSALQRSPSFTPERCLLAWMGLPAEATDERQILKAAVGVTHPSWSLLERPESERPTSPENWATFLALNRGAAQWLQLFEAEDDVQPLLYALLLGDLSKQSMHSLVAAALA